MAPFEILTVDITVADAVFIDITIDTVIILFIALSRCGRKRIITLKPSATPAP
jgi:hypothetical protein